MADKHSLFAIISTTFNQPAFQYLNLMVFSDFSALYVIMFFGELALYSLMGIFATIIFWGT